MNQLLEIQINYFKSKISEPNENGCMLWNGSLCGNGYGRVQFYIDNKRKTILSHRLALWLVKKPINKKLICCHKPIICHNKLCCNPEHLRWDTPKNNSKDMILDGTSLKGIKHHQAKLTENQVKEIKQLLLNGETLREIAKKFNVSNPTIGYIKNSKTWIHVTLD